MNLLTEMNNALATVLPIWIWDYLQVFFGFAVAWGTLVQRTYGNRFKTSTITCTADSITTRIGQVALSVIGTLAFVVALDGWLPPASPPRSFLVVFLASYFAVQVRIIYLTFAHTIRDLCEVRNFV